MPLWQIYHPEGIFTDNESKRAFTADITTYYTNLGLPAFYVNVHFYPLPSHSHWVGNEQITDAKPFIRIVITQIAITAGRERAEIDPDTVYKSICDRIDKVLKPHVADKGWDWEYHVLESERRLWKINGLIPPAWRSEEESRWREANKPLRYEGDH